jgi:hypothetical protein|tara:strand:- start:562 stop:765 length:204 start_codon:yes stop_codon:yes gene_type:complete
VVKKLRTYQDWYRENKEHKSEYARNWYIKNKPRISEDRKIKYNNRTTEEIEIDRQRKKEYYNSRKEK